MLYLSYFYKLANGEADRDIDKINPEVEYLKSELGLLFFSFLFSFFFFFLFNSLEF